MVYFDENAGGGRGRSCQSLSAHTSVIQIKYIVVECMKLADDIHVIEIFTSVITNIDILLLHNC